MLSSFFVAGRAGGGRLDTLRAAVGESRNTPASNWGQNLWFISLLILGVSSLMGSINYITTIINMRAPGMTLFPHAADRLVAVHHGDLAAAGACRC